MSDPLFTEGQYKKIVGEFIIKDFLENVSEDSNSLHYLKYLADIYLKVLPSVESYEDPLARLDRYLSSQELKDISEKFEFKEKEAKDLFYVPHIFQEIMKKWVNHSKAAKIEQSGELKIPIDPSDTDYVAQQLATMFSFSKEDVINFEKEEAAVFAKTLIKICKELLGIEDQPDNPIEGDQPCLSHNQGDQIENQSSLSRNPAMWGMGTLGLGLASIIGISMLRGRGVISPTVAVEAEPIIVNEETLSFIASTFNSVVGAIIGGTLGVVGGPRGIVRGISQGSRLGSDLTIIDLIFKK